MFSVRVRLPLAELGPLMGDMRVWLDKRAVVPAAFHCHDAPGGMEIEISFDKESDARDCGEQFGDVPLVVEVHADRLAMSGTRDGPWT
jgi:hypothetical protein